MNDPFDLARFVTAQDPVIDAVRGELRGGRKRSHWMWFVFPQCAGLGFSPMAQRFAIGSLAEVEAYLAHPILGPRLRECVGLVRSVEGRSAHDIFGSPDDMKFRSCLTLFAEVAPGEFLFLQTLEKYYAGVADAATLAFLASRHST